jgi:iron complex outermembrane receptor protein
MITRFLLRAAALPPVMFGLSQTAIGQTAPETPLETVVVTGTRATMESDRAELDAEPGKANASALGGNFRVDVDSFRLANKTLWELEGERQLELGFSIEEQALFHPIVDRVMVDFDGPGPAPAVEVFSLLVDTDHSDIGSMARYRQRVGAHDLIFGLNFGHNAVDGGNYRNLGGLPNGLTTRIDNRATQLELFAMDRWSLNERLSIVLAAQSVSADRDVRNTDAVTNVLDNPKDSYSQINPRIGIIYAPRDELSIYANASRLFEAPTSYELQDNVAGGDATLDPMSGTVFEVGTRGGGDLGARGSWAWDFSYYYARIDDEILSVEDPTAPGTSLVTNIDATVHSGVEGVLSASIGLGSGRSIEPLVSFTLNDFRFDADPVYGNNRLAAAPDYFVRGELIYRSADGFYAGPTFEFVGRRYADFANTYAIDSHGLLGVRAGWSSGRWTFFADLRNVLDEAYVANHAVRNVAGPDDAILNPGEPASAYFGMVRMVD